MTTSNICLLNDVRFALNMLHIASAAWTISAFRFCSYFRRKLSTAKQYQRIKQATTCISHLCDRTTSFHFQETFINPWTFAICTVLEIHFIFIRKMLKCSPKFWSFAVCLAQICNPKNGLCLDNEINTWNFIWMMFNVLRISEKLLNVSKPVELRKFVCCCFCMMHICNNALKSSNSSSLFSEPMILHFARIT